MAAATAAVAAATFRSLHQATANGVPVPLPSVRFQSLQCHRVDLCLFAAPRGRSILLPPPAAAAGEAFSSDGEEFGGEDEEYFEEEEGSEPEEQVEAPRAYSSPRSRPPRGEDPGRLFVGNLPYTFTSEELSEAFGEAGRVDDAQIIYDKVTNRSRGFAFITMATAEEAAKAIQMFDGALLGGRTARVNYPEVPRGGERRTVTMAGRRRDDGTYKIYAGNLGWGVRADTLKAVFEGQAGLIDARVIFERETGRSRGFGFLSFRTLEDAQAALEALDGVELEGRPLRLSLAEQNPPPGGAVQAQQEETASDISDAEPEATSSSESSEAELDESNFQTAATY
ncbi:RNA-binding protein CP33, chloroplastic [Dichanthelium oligosanthes]|uniref:RNA-binding protein CP33, chloroplastic n=1 Tax=Dichanthelium oligosanthes TaxID=888268 RepID=A0A1E5V8I5_9POAL|nr:RNA-binding protein CP33, chloroplastic [Dichanthelium oligosanthes]